MELIRAPSLCLHEGAIERETSDIILFDPPKLLFPPYFYLSSHPIANNRVLAAFSAVFATIFPKK